MKKYLVILSFIPALSIASPNAISSLSSDKELCEEYRYGNKSKQNDAIDLLYRKCVDQAYDDNFFGLLNRSSNNKAMLSNIKNNTYMISTRLTLLNLLIAMNSSMASTTSDSLDKETFRLTINKLNEFYIAKSLAINNEISSIKDKNSAEIVFIMLDNEKDLHEKILQQFNLSERIIAKTHS